MGFDEFVLDMSKQVFIYFKSKATALLLNSGLKTNLDEANVEQ